MPYDSDCIHEDIFSLSMEWNEKELEAIKKAVNNVTTREKKFMMSLAPQVNILWPIFIYCLLNRIANVPYFVHLSLFTNLGFEFELY